MKCKNIQLFSLKSCDSINNQPNNNVSNSKLKYLYNIVKAVWMMNYGSKKFSPRHMNFDWWKHGTPSRCLLATSSGTVF